MSTSQTTAGTVAEWFHMNGDVSVGPRSGDEIREGLESGRIEADTLLWRIGMPTWKPASEIPAFRDPDAPPLPEPTEDVSPSAAPRDPNPSTAQPADEPEPTSARENSRTGVSGRWLVGMVGNFALAVVVGLLFVLGFFLLRSSGG